jgi:hypothetical protein
MVILGSARSDENGKAHGGKPGDQAGREVSTQKWYKHKLGWRVLRAKDPAAAVKIAKAMRAACDNPRIGYDQYQRDTLYNAVKDVGFDPGRADKDVETDCSALVRVCCAYAGIMLGNFTTGNQAAVMLASGKFDEMKGSKYTDEPDYLRTGDVLVTRTKGHTVVVLTDGSDVKTYALGDRIIKHGMSGDDVRDLQVKLMTLGYALPKYGADGDYGGETIAAVKEFQENHDLDSDGDYGPDTHRVLMDALDGYKPNAWVKITGDCHLRIGPGKKYESVGVAKAGDTLEAPDVDDWTPVLVGGKVLWASKKYVQG